MKNLPSFLCGILFACSAKGADTFAINGKDIIVPAPEGFVRVTDEMTGLKRFFQYIQDHGTDTLARYISESDVPAAMAGEVVKLDRYFIVKINKQLRSITMGKEDFSKLKERAKSENKNIFEEIKSEIPQHANKISQGISQEFDIDYATNISSIVPLDPHYESDNAFGFSMYMKRQDTVGSQKIKTILSATAIFINTSGTLLFLYGYAPQNQLEWTRSASTKWAESVMVMNTQPPLTSPTTQGRGFNWGKIIAKGLTGAIAVLLIGLIGGAISHFDKRKTSKHITELIYISRNGQEEGPYNAQLIQQMLADDSIDVNTLAWKEGLSEWIPLAQILGSVPPEP